MSHPYVCENCRKDKICNIAGCQGTCTKLCVKCCAQSLRDQGLKVAPSLTEECECGGGGMHNHGCSQYDYAEEETKLKVAPTHTSDEQCTVDPETGLCRECGVDHSGECPGCHGHGFHKPECTEPW